MFVDTPGFQTRHRSRLNERLNRAVRDSLADVDVVVWSSTPRGSTDADRAVVALLPRSDAGRRRASTRSIASRDKAALLPRLAEIAALRAFAAIVPVSAEDGTQLDALQGRDRDAAAGGRRRSIGDDELTDRDERFLAAEFVREKIFRLLGEEVPYATTVAIDRFEQRRRSCAASTRRCYVDRASQRAILLGEGGARMKAIATQARARHGAPVRRPGATSRSGCA